MGKKPKDTKIIEPVGDSFEDVMSVLARPVGPKKKDDPDKGGDSDHKEEIPRVVPRKKQD